MLKVGVFWTCGLPMSWENPTIVLILAPQCVLVFINHWITRWALPTPGREYFLLRGCLWNGLKHGELLI